MDFQLKERFSRIYKIKNCTKIIGFKIRNFNFIHCFYGTRYKLH